MYFFEIHNLDNIHNIKVGDRIKIISDRACKPYGKDILNQKGTVIGVANKLAVIRLDDDRQHIGRYGQIRVWLNYLKRIKV